MKNPFVAVKDYFRSLPDKKKYIEVITASLSIPVLLSVIYMNYTNIQEKRNDRNVTPTPTIEKEKEEKPTIITIIKEKEAPTPIPTQKAQISLSPTEKITQKECIEEIGPISIENPKEGEVLTEDPVEINVRYDQGNYCSVVWRYRINTENWSDFSDNNFTIYDLPEGEKTLELEVKSLVSKETKNIKVNFTYQKDSEAITSPSPSPSN